MYSFMKNRRTAAQEAARPSLYQRLKQRLGRTRGSLTEGLARLVRGKKAIDDEILEEIETRLLMADVGADATARIIADLTARVQRKQLDDAAALLAALKEDMHVILAAGDTFRAAAVEQVQTWGERNDIAVTAQARAADPASVVFDALQAAKARGTDVLIADTAGRLHTQANLMEELKKIKRVMTKLEPAAPHETLLVIDAGTGQNALNQARQFHEAVGLTGLILTKLDGTAKGGIIFAIAEQMKLPIRFIGVGEGIDDLRPFDAGDFVEA